MSRTILILMFLAASTAAANAQASVTGTLLGSDGKPIPKATVSLRTISLDSTLKTVDAIPDGKYNITIGSPGVWALTYTGPDQNFREVALYLDKPERIGLDVRFDNPVKVTFADSESVAARIAGIYEEMQNNQHAIMTAYQEYKKSGKAPGQFRYNWSNELASLTKRIDEEKNPVIRQGLVLDYIGLGSLTANLDTTIVRQALADISPASMIWEFSPNLVRVAVDLAQLPAAEANAYVQNLLEENPSVSVKSSVAFSLFMFAKETGNKADASKYYNILTRDYANTRYGREVAERFPAVSRIEVGKPVPAFSVVSMADSTKVITNETLKGKYYLMDFWATWCGPCVVEMPNLDKAYKDFHDKDFTILSLSLDTSPADVTTFRKDKWPMPWLHTFIGRSSKSNILNEFEVAFIPKPILVNPQGIIIAMGDSLRGDGLEKTLEKDLGK